MVALSEDYLSVIVTRSKPKETRQRDVFNACFFLVLVCMLACAMVRRGMKE